MGKAQTKKKTAKRHNPVRVPDAHLGAGRLDGPIAKEKERQMLPVMAKLRSAEYADRTWACAAICNLISGDAATRRLFQGKNVVGELIERLSDSVDEVVVEASGALRNLAIDGGHELCGEMFNKGIMPHLAVLMGKINGTIDSVLTADPKTLTDEQVQNRKHLLNLTENVISLIWSLAEASHKTLAAVNDAGCESLLIKVLEGRDALSVGVTVAAAHALYSLTQDNPPFSKALSRNDATIGVLVNMARKDHTQGEKDIKGKGKSKGEAEDDDEIGDGRVLLSRVLVAGALRNIIEPGSRADKTVGIAELTNEVILPLVNSLLDVNLGNVVDRVTQLVSEVPKDEVAVTGKNLLSDHRSPAERKLERVERMLTTVVTALEILTGICAGLEDVEEGMEQDNSGGDDDDVMEDAMADEDLIAKGRDPTSAVASAATPAVNAGSLPQLLGPLRLPERLSALAQLTPLSFPPTGSEPSIHPPTTAVLSTLHLRALEALNNLLLTTAAALAASPEATIANLIPAAGVWEVMFGVVSGAGSDAAALTARGQEMRLEVIEAALGCVWGLSKAAPSALSPSDVQIDMLMQVVPAQSSDTMRSRTIDTLASLGSRPSVTVEENAKIGRWVMESLAASSSTEITVALLNAVIDMYADETRNYDQVFVSGNYIQQLAALVARFRSEARKVDRRKDYELRVRAEEVYENLVAFIKYRRSLR